MCISTRIKRNWINISCLTVRYLVQYRIVYWFILFAIVKIFLKKRLDTLGSFYLLVLVWEEECFGSLGSDFCQCFVGIPPKPSNNFFTSDFQTSVCDSKFLAHFLITYSLKYQMWILMTSVLSTCISKKHSVLIF